MSSLQDLLTDELKEDNRRIRVDFAFQEWTGLEGQWTRGSPKAKTVGQAKSLLEFYDLVRQATKDYETRAGTPEAHQVIFTEEEPDVESETETITFSLVKRQPGAFSQGAPMESKVKNRRPMFREAGEDPTEPGYRYVVNGYWYDNIVRFTCWARTNKAANARAGWFEDMMEWYTWWFVKQGVSRVLFEERQPDLTVVIDNNKWYGRSLDYFVRTEKLRTFKEKELEEVIIKLGVASSI